MAVMVLAAVIAQPLKLAVAAALELGANNSMKKIIILITFLILIGSAFYFFNKISEVEEEILVPEEVLVNLEAAIVQATKSGDYHCCIDPPCTMCYLGHWKFEKGTCYCDDAIREGRDEDVCPECKKGLEQGLCNSISL